MAEITLSNGEVVEVKGLTLKQAKACNLTKVINNMAGAVTEEGESKVALPFDEDTILKVVSLVYPKAMDLSFSDAINLFMAVIKESSIKN